MRVVLTRLDRVGDLILSTPAIASARRSWPDAHITFVASRANASVLTGSSDIDELVVLAPEADPAKVGRDLRAGCDLAIALAPRTADWRLVAGTGAGRRVGYTYVRRYLARLIARRYLSDLCVSDADPGLSEANPDRAVRHEVDQVLDLVRRAGGREIVSELAIQIDATARAAVAGVPSGAVAVHLAPRWLRGGSSLELFIATLRDLRILAAPIVVTYGDNVREAAERVATTGVADHVIGHLDFAAWAAIFEKSRVIVTVDTSATHVASAVKTPVVVVYEHRFFEVASREWAPYRVPGVVLRKPAAESPQAQQRLREEIVAAAQSLSEHV